MTGRLHSNRRCPGRWPVVVPLLLLHVQACADAGTGDAADSRRPVSLGPPDAVFPEDFGYVHTVRELPGGDVLVADPLGKALYQVDMDAGVRTVVGKLGEGPEEYQQPDAVWPLPGDSTLMVDLGQGAAGQGRAGAGVRDGAPHRDVPGGRWGRDGDSRRDRPRRERLRRRHGRLPARPRWARRPFSG